APSATEATDQAAAGEQANAALLSTATAMACALILLHPICVESVVWVTGRKDVLAALFVVAALLVDDRRIGTGEGARRSSEVTPRPTTPPKTMWRWRAMAPGLLLFVCAVLTKTSALCYPVVLVAWLRFVRKLDWRNAMAAVWLHAVVAGAVAYDVVRIWSTNQMIGQVRPAGLWLDVPASYGVYARHWLWPVDLAAVYPLEPAGFGAGGVAVLLLAAALVGLWSRLPGMARFWVVATVAALAPVVNVIPVYYRYSDRYAFLAWILAIAPLAAALVQAQRVLRDRRIRAALLAVVLGLGAALGALTYRQAGTWSDSMTLWEWNTRAQPDGFWARMKYGETLRDAERWSEAATHYQAAIRLRRDTAFGYVGLFYCYARQAESEGLVTSGRPDRWLQKVGDALRSARTLRQLRAEVQGAGCVRCARILLLLELRRWPPDDEELLAHASRALADGRRQVALIYLNEVNDRRHKDFASLWRQAVGER
ncbi:MAG: hypothetical protein AAGC55_18795, partial [Myxococcota bacterium]